jgi:hypothetical protein
MRSARCEARLVYPIKDNTKHEFPQNVEREGVNGLRGGRKCSGRSGRIIMPASVSSNILEIITYLLIELSPSWGETKSAATQEFPSILWNPKVHYRVQKTPPMVSILSQNNPIHTITSYLSKIHFNIVHFLNLC